jgi:adenine deaminase
MGCTINAPFMTLAFMALPVIPDLKLTDMYLFDGIAFAQTSLWIK